jgi:hypothetical protein
MDSGEHNAIACGIFCLHRIQSASATILIGAEQSADGHNLASSYARTDNFQ